jgi:Uma2 family endonuclease
MTLVNEPDLQRFVFNHVDWAFYEDVSRRLEGRHVFVTYYKGKLEVVTTSLLHERVAALLYRLLCVLSEETATPTVTAGRATLRDLLLDEGVEADTSFYFHANAERMKDKQEIDLKVDPPPDLAVEVEITRRLGERRLIYRDLGVPEVWRYADGTITVLVRRGEDYVSVKQSPTFPFVTLGEIAGWIRAGIGQDETTWTAGVRKRVRDALPPKSGDRPKKSPGSRRR